jgi:hypothetical protein
MKARVPLFGLKSAADRRHCRCLLLYECRRQALDCRCIAADIRRSAAATSTTAAAKCQFCRCRVPLVPLQNVYLCLAAAKLPLTAAARSHNSCLNVVHDDRFAQDSILQDVSSARGCIWVIRMPRTLCLTRVEHAPQT